MGELQIAESFLIAISIRWECRVRFSLVFTYEIYITGKEYKVFLSESRLFLFPFTFYKRASFSLLYP